MKQYIAPRTFVFELEVTEVIAGSGPFIGISDDPSTDFAPEIRRGAGWDEYEN